MKILEKHLRTPTSFPKAKRSHTERHSPGEPDVIYPGKRRHTTGRLFTASSQSEASANTTKGLRRSALRIGVKDDDRVDTVAPEGYGSRTRKMGAETQKTGTGNPKEREPDRRKLERQKRRPINGNGYSNDKSGNSLAQDGNPQGRKRRPDKTGAEAPRAGAEA